MKVTARLIGNPFARAEALVADARRRALERLQARIEAERAARRGADQRSAAKPARQ